MEQPGHAMANATWAVAPAVLATTAAAVPTSDTEELTGGSQLAQPMNAGRETMQRRDPLWWKASANEDGEEEESASSSAGQEVDTRVPPWWQGAAEEDGGEEESAGDHVDQSVETRWPEVGEQDGDHRPASQQVPLWWQQGAGRQPGVSGSGLPGDEWGREATLHVPCFLGCIRPCGHMVIPESGMDVTTPLGKLHIFGRADCGSQKDEWGGIFSDHITHVCVAFAALWVLAMLATPGLRQEFMRGVGGMLSGKVQDDSGEMSGPTEEEAEADVEDGHGTTTDSPSVPCSIYLALAVLHPGIIGFGQWLRYTLMGLACMCMQLYIPIQFAAQVLSEWEFNNLKSPAWFLTDFWTFLGTFIALAALYNLFASKCIENIMGGAEAAFLVLRADMPREAKAQGSEGLEGLLFLLLEPAIQGAVATNTYLWTCVSLGMHIAMSFLLQATMLLRVATYTGSVEQLVVVAVSLYFVLDLDARAVESDLGLRLHYHRRMALLTKEAAEEEAGRGAVCVARIAVATAAALRSLVPLGLLAALLMSWRQRETGRVLGGNNLCLRP